MKKILFKALALTCAFTGTALSAPLTDVAGKHWVKDAVATLSERGILQGYGDATFQGDRALTRWELAAVVVSLLAKVEANQVNFATVQERDALQRLVTALRPELEALGVRITALEQKTQELDTRLTELERITFYGSISTYVGGQCFYNTSKPGVGNALLDYDHIVGTAAGAGGVLETGPAAGMSMNPFLFGNMTVTDWTSGRPLTNGTSFTSTMRLGTNIRINDDFRAGAEFAAYASAGDSVVDAYWGAAAPYNCNRFTAVAASSNGTGADNRPYTRLCLDRFWLEHQPTKTRLTVGSFEDTNFDSFVYVSPVNPNVNGNKFLGSNGVKIEGDIALGVQDNSDKLQWQAMFTRLPDGNVNPYDPTYSYFTHSEGANLTYLFDSDRGRLRFNYLHTANSNSDGERAASGMYVNSSVILGWINPNNPSAIAIGPQDMNNYGFSGRYRFDVTCQPEVYAEYGHTDYRADAYSKNTVSGNMMRAGVTSSIGKNAYNMDVVNLDLGYKAIDPTYNPFILPLDQVGGISTVLWRPAGFTYQNSLYSLIDTDEYIHNRKGLDAEIKWRFLPTGNITLSYGNYSQVKTSMQDVRIAAGSLGEGLPATTVMGYTPGFVDTVFMGYAPQTFTSDGTDPLGKALEDPRGYVDKWSASIGFKIPFDRSNPKGAGVTLGGGGRNTHFSRRSHLSELVPGASGLAGENQNNVDLHVGGWKVFVKYEPSEDLALDFSLNNAFLNGHLDPLGILNDQAAMTGRTNDKLVDLHQIIPQIKVDYDINAAWSVGLTGRYYWTTDRLPAEHTVHPHMAVLGVDYGVQENTHPATWQGWQLMTHCNFKF